MSVDTLTPELVDSLRSSAREVLETMVSTTPEAIDAVQEPTSSFKDEVVGLLGFTGTRCGTFAVRTTEIVARTLAARMLMMAPAELTDFAEAADGFGELVNMISGNFKNAWVANGNQMDLSMPNVIHRGFVRLNSDGAGALACCVRIKIAEGEIRAGVHFEAK